MRRSNALSDVTKRFRPQNENSLRFRSELCRCIALRRLVVLNEYSGRSGHAMPVGRHILIVVNPISGHGRGLRTATNMSISLRERGCEVTIHRTETAGDAERITRDVSVDDNHRPYCVVACGGDGTMQEVANALAPLVPSLGNACPVMGLAPTGRCNDFSRVLGVTMDTKAMVNVLTTGKPRSIDLGRVNDRYFCTVATAGIDAQVSSYVDSMRVPLSGTAAYLYGAVCVLSRYRPQRLRLVGDFGVIDQPLFLASSANTSSYGGAIKIAPGAVPTDGQLDLCLIESVSRLRAMRLLPTVLAGRHCSLPEVRFIQSKRFTIESDEPLELWADGERVGRTPATIQVVPGAVRVMVPRDFENI